MSMCHASFTIFQATGSTQQVLHARVSFLACNAQWRESVPRVVHIGLGTDQCLYHVAVTKLHVRHQATQARV